MKKLRITAFPEAGYACAEAINTLSTNISFSGADVKKVLITSCQASEGKSFVSMNLMRTLAGYGKTVVLVDGDLRRSAINDNYGLISKEDPKLTGLAHYLSGQAEMEEVTYETDITGAYFVPVGREVSNPLPLLNSSRFSALLDSLAQQVDYVIVDAPPLGLVIDAAEMSKSCDGSLIVVQYNNVRRQMLLDVKSQLEQTGCPILGTVLNQVDLGDALNRKYYYKGYYKGYGSYYGHSDHKKKSVKSLLPWNKKK